jgi:hypothetical protein
MKMKVLRRSDTIDCSLLSRFDSLEQNDDLYKNMFFSARVIDDDELR